MRDRNILVTPFSFLNILKLKIVKEVNNHFTAEIAGHISQDDGDKYVRSNTSNSSIQIEAIDVDGTHKTLFRGIIDHIWTETVAGLKTLHIKAVTRSILLDQNCHIRTFQNERQTYQAVCEVIKRANQDATFIYMDEFSKSSNGILVQYDETDWEFLKRIASRVHSVVVPDCVNNNLCLSMGMPHKADHYMVDTASYRIEKEVGEYIFKNVNSVPSFSEQDAITYIFDSREIWDICSEVVFQKQTLYIYKIDSNYNGQELINTYYLRSENGFKTIKQNNLKLMGISLSGKVEKVKNDVVKISVDKDENSSGKPDKWFFFSTVYSSPDGTGWYCMPEEDDAVRLYFPDEYEENAYVVSAVHVGKHRRRRKNPDIKSLRTIHGKEVEFTPHTLKVTNNNGMSIILDDKKGIRIISKKDIVLQSSQNIHINGGMKVNIQGKMGVNMKQQDSQIDISEDLHEIAQGVYHK